MKSKIKRILGRTIFALATICILNACGTVPGMKISEPEKRFEPKQENRPAASPKDVPPPSPKEAPFAHKVRWKGETLFHISKWYTGSPYNWKAITAANHGLDPDKIVIGQEIVIPEKLLKNRKPMTPDSIPSFRKKATVAPVASRPVPTPQQQPDSALDTNPTSPQTASPNPETIPEDDPGDIELFGPVDVE